MVTFFTTAKPFRGHSGIIQRNALKSWTLLHPGVEVILFGDDEDAAETAQALGIRHEPHVERNEYGTKRLDYIFRKAQAIARHNLLCYINCDIVLTQDFCRALGRVNAAHSKFLMVGRRWDMNITEPLDFVRADWQERLVTRARAEGCQRFYHNVDYFLFSRGLYDAVPPLVIGRIWWDHWLVGKARMSGEAVVDVSDVVCAVHQNHDYGYHPQGVEGVSRDLEAQRNYELARAETRLRTIEDATYRLKATGIKPNRFYWLAPAKRLWRQASKKVRGNLRTRMWHPLLNVTRPMRHAMGLKHDLIPRALRSRHRRHWMDL
jgi:hypothetical protein